MHQYFGFADVVDILLSAAHVINSLSLSVSSFKGAAVGLYVLGLLAIIAGSIVLGLAIIAGFVDLSTFGKNFFLSCSVGRPNLVLHRIQVKSLLLINRPN